MPLFMDLHKASDYDTKPTVEDIKRNHIADLEVQHKYGVKFLQYWINEDAGLVFCLMEAPNKEACSAVHAEAHGAMPCNIIELKGGDYLAYMGDENKPNEFDIVENPDGTLDAGYRLIMAVDIISIEDHEQVQQDIDELITKSGGRVLNQPGHRTTAIFTTGAQAIECAANIVNAVQDQPAEVRIGISAGEPVTEQQEIFADAIQLANRLCDVAQHNQALVSSLAKELTPRSKLTAQDSLKILKAEDEQFLNNLLNAIAPMLTTEDAGVENLSEAVGMSRSGLYRKITDLTGSSANALIHELRMQKALRLLRNKYGNVTQVALEAGFNNPSYFAKSFQKRFGILPFRATRLDS